MPRAKADRSPLAARELFLLAAANMNGAAGAEESQQLTAKSQAASLRESMVSAAGASGLLSRFLIACGSGAP